MLRGGLLLGKPRSGDTWVQPGDPAAAWVRWVGVASAGVECGGGADRQADAHELCGQTVHRRRYQ
jgi:hypothetical protein